MTGAASAHTVESTSGTTGPTLTLMVLPSARGHHDAAAVLESVVAQRRPECEILVIGTQEAAHPSGENDRARSITRVQASDSPSPAEAFNAGLAAASGEFVVAVEQPLADAAVVTIIEALQAGDDLDVLYGDDGGYDDAGTVVATHRRPDFSPERLRSHMYLGTLTVYRAALLRDLGGYRDGLPGAEAYDLALRATERARSVTHLPQVLSIVPESRNSTVSDASSTAAAESGLRAVSEHLDRTIGGSAAPGRIIGSFRIRREVKGAPLVSIIIPTRGSSAVVHGENRCLVVEAVRGIVDRSDYKAVEIVVVVDEATPQQVIEELRSLAGDRLVIVPWTEPFSFSGKVNRGVVCSRGDYLLLLNDDTEVISSDWIQSMLAIAQQPDVGMVGVMLYFEDGSIQHAGHLYDHGNAGHIGFGWPHDASGPDGAFVVDREVSGVTAACALLPRQVYWEVGGLSTVFPGNYNDVDLSMKVTGAGYRIIWTPWAELVHFESKTRVPTIGQRELRAIRERWGHRMRVDPYWPDGPGDFVTRR